MRLKVQKRRDVVCHPVVRLTSIYRIGARTRRRKPGTGFLVEGWDNTIITAAHVLRGDSRVQKLTKVRIDLIGRGGRRGYAWGAAVAFSDESDLAIVRVHRGIRTHETLRFAADTTGEAGTLMGFPSGKARLRSQKTRVEHIEPWIRYEKYVGSAGMSGGPFVTSDGVVALHRGRFKRAGQLVRGARLLDVEFLKECTRAARELLDE